ncbi:MAG: sodium bile acid symporter family-domain-containing protein [Linnemannia elongata]|nr:MAG: sodium bile acid symporter family-domain-containing protein [Linnemannia elongata]
MWGLSLIDTLLPLWIIICMVGGVLIGYYVPNVETVLDAAKFADVSLPIAIGLLVMMYPVFCRIKYEELGALFQGRFMRNQILFSLVVNWIVAPLFMVALAWMTLPDLPDYRSGVILVGVARCIAMVLIWNQLAGGNQEFCAVTVAINSILQIVLYGPLAYFYVVIVGKGTTFHIDMWIIVRSVLIYMGIPLLAGFLTRFALRRYEWYNKTFVPAVGKLSLLALLYVIVVMFALQGHEIVNDIGNVLRTAVPLILYFLAIFAGVLAWCLATKVPYDIAVPQCFTAASNNFELAIAVAVGTYGVKSKEALAATIGPLIEVPMLLLLVYVIKFVRDRWYPSKLSVQSGSEKNNDVEIGGE